MSICLNNGLPANQTLPMLDQELPDAVAVARKCCLRHRL